MLSPGQPPSLFTKYLWRKPARTGFGAEVLSLRCLKRKNREERLCSHQVSRMSCRVSDGSCQEQPVLCCRVWRVEAAALGQFKVLAKTAEVDPAWSGEQLPAWSLHKVANIQDVEETEWKMVSVDDIFQKRN